MRRAFIKIALIVLIGMAGSRTAAAQSGSDSTAADVLFEEGRTALARGDVAVACEKFDASRRLEPAVGTLLNFADCSARLDRRRVAWVAFREALRFMSATDERRGYAQERITALESKLARLTLRWEGAPLADARVVVNDEPISPPYDAPRVVDPGRIAVRVEAPGHRARDFTTHAPMGGSTALMIGPGETTPADTSAQTMPGRDRPGRRMLGFTVGGIGVASLGVGTAFGIAALGSSSSASDRCSGNACPDAEALATARDEARTASTQATVSTVLLASGALVALAGIYLVITATERPAGLRSATAPIARRDPLGIEF